MTGNLDQLSEEELQSKMKQILEDHKNIINITAEEDSVDAEEIITKEE